MSRYSSAWPAGRTPSISATTTERMESSRRATALGLNQSRANPRRRVCSGGSSCCMSPAPAALSAMPGPRWLDHVPGSMSTPCTCSALLIEKRVRPSASVRCTGHSARNRS